MNNNTNKTASDIPAELQMTEAESKKATIPDILTIITGLIIIFGLAVLMFVLPDQTFSEQENRTLQQFPEFSKESFWAGSRTYEDRDGNEKEGYTKKIAKYYSDQFPFRDMFAGLKGLTEIAMLKGENNNVMLGQDNYLITKDDELKIDEAIEQLRTNIDYISEFADVMNAMGKIPVTLAAAGRSVDALKIYLPPAYPKDSSSYSDKLWVSFNGLADYAKNIKRLNLLDPLRGLINKRDGREYYYRTDHHWTTLGAYYAYVEIIKSFKEDGLEPLPLSAFELEVAADDFYGTTWSKAGMKWIEPDIMYFYRYKGDEDFVTTLKDAGKTFNGFYDYTYLEKKDKYGAFLSGNNSRVDIVKPGEKRQKLLIIKDSFAHSAVPFLAYHYDLVILDLRYYFDSAAMLVLDEEIDRVLFLHNIQNLSEDDIYGMLRFEAAKALNAYEKEQFPIRRIFINGNPIEDYKIVYPVEESKKRQDGHELAAENLREMILTRTGIELEIAGAVNPEDLHGLDKVIMFLRDGLPESNMIKIATEGNNLVFTCNIGDDSSVYAVNIFIDKYLRKAAGSFNFGADFIYTDLGGDSFIMITPPAD